MCNLGDIYKMSIYSSQCEVIDFEMNSPLSYLNSLILLPFEAANKCRLWQLQIC